MILQVAHSHQDTDSDLDLGAHLDVPHKDYWESRKHNVAECCHRWRNVSERLLIGTCTNTDPRQNN